MAQQHVYFAPSLSLAGARDDNLFYTAESRQSDVISRLTPGFETGGRWERLSVAGRWALDLERFAEHTELDTNRAREAASFDFGSRLSRPLTFSLHGEYLSTLTPGELNLATGLSAGRSRARRSSARPSLDWKLGATTVASVAYTRTKDDLASGVATQTHTSALSLEHHLSPRTSATTGYSFSRYLFEESAPIDVHTLTVGWERRFGPKSSFALSGGPRYSNGRFDPEASLSLQRSAGTVDTSLTLSRSLSTVIGQAGTFVTDSALAGLSYRPVTSLRFGVSPGVYSIKDPAGGPETRVYVAGLEMSWRISDWLALESLYRRNLQRGILVSAAPGGGGVHEIARDTFYLGLVAGRKDAGAAAAAGRSPGGKP